MLVVSNISKQFRGADALILSKVSFTVNAGERVGLIGPNGCGKSTLLYIITGALSADSGGILRTPLDLRIGYLAQGLTVPDDTPIQNVLFPQIDGLAQAEADLERLASAVTDRPDAALMTAYSEALERLERFNDEIDTPRAERLLSELALPVRLDATVGILSGGQKTRLGLAALLVNDPQLLILDEPTNHLDITALEWLETWLQRFQGGALIVSHDRTFLDETVNRIVALDHKTHAVRIFEGNYSQYVAAVRSELDKHWAQWRDQQVEIERLKTDARRTMEHANQSNADGGDRLAAKAAKRAHAKEKRVEQYLASDERVEKPTQSWQLKLDFDALPTSGQAVIATENLSIGYDPAAPLVSDLNLSVRAGERIALVGPNGQGKSTLIKTFLGEVLPLSGRVRIGSSVRIGYLAQEQEILDPTGNALSLVQAEAPQLQHTEARSFLHFFLFSGDDVFRPVAQLSFGERARLMLALLVARGANVLILDEPINHLDVPSREQFEQAMNAFQGSVLAVVHDRYFVDRFATTIWTLKDHALTVDFHSTEHRAVFRR